MYQLLYDLLLNKTKEERIEIISAIYEKAATPVLCHIGLD